MLIFQTQNGERHTHTQHTQKVHGNNHRFEALVSTHTHTHLLAPDADTKKINTSVRVWLVVYIYLTRRGPRYDELIVSSYTHTHTILTGNEKKEKKRTTVDGN